MGRKQAVDYGQKYWSIWMKLMIWMLLRGFIVNGDGAAWIRTGEKIIPKSKYALDKYHMHKYIIAATSHLEDSAEDARGEIYRAIHRKKKWMAEGAFDRIIGITDKETKRKAVEQAKAYILGNWSGIMIAMKSGDSNGKMFRRRACEPCVRRQDEFKTIGMVQNRGR